MFKIGDHVWADFGTGRTIAHVAVDKHTNDTGEDKYGIQHPDGSVHDLSHREPADRDAAGSGGTFWSV